MSVSVTLRIPIADSWRAGYTLQIYGDGGSGTIDLSNPLLPARQLIFPEAKIERGLGAYPLDEVPFGGDAPPNGPVGGFGDQPYGEEVDGYGEGRPYVDVVVEVDEGFGAWTFAAEVADAAGNVQTDALVETVHLVGGEDPAPVSSFSFNSYDSGNDQAVFDVAL